MPALGRRVEHDERSRNYSYRLPPTVTTQTVRHQHYGPVLDQGDVGACTGYAMAQWLNTHPAHKPRTPYLPGDTALHFYSRATQLDPWDGWYNLATKVEDTGSSGLAACKAAKEQGYITGYQWIFEGTPQLIAALQHTPVMAGTVWLANMSKPQGGYLNVSGNTVGGHEYVIIGWNQPSKYFTMLNSWSDGWGRNGYARIHEQDMAHLLAQQGDLTVPTI
jgi:hypothetical protein